MPQGICQILKNGHIIEISANPGDVATDPFRCSDLIQTSQIGDLIFDIQNTEYSHPIIECIRAVHFALLSTSSATFRKS